MLRFGAVRNGQLQGLDRDKVPFAQATGNIRCGHDRAGRTVADAATVKKPEWLGDHRCIHHPVFIDFVTQVGFGVARTVVVAFDRDVGHGLFQVFRRHPVFCGVSRCQLGK